MSHKRKEIRYAIKSLLEGKTRALFRIWCDRTRAIWDDETPSIIIWAGDETVEVFNESPRRYKRTQEINIETYVTSVNEIDDDNDFLMAQIEKVIEDADLFTLSKTISDILYNGSSIELRGETSKEGAVGTLRYLVIYYTFAGVSPDTLDWAEGFNVSWDETDTTKDTIDFAIT